MAESKTLLMSILCITLTILFSSLASAQDSGDYYQDISPNFLGLQKEKLAHLHFYFHDMPSGPNATAVVIAQAQDSKTFSNNFGQLLMADEPLTVGPELNSKQVGKAQGLYGYSAQDEFGLIMLFNLEFTEGKYNGSTLSLFGRNKVLSAVREMPIVGGSGAFRFARGYAQAKTHTLDSNTGKASVEYNVYLFHY